MSATRPDTAGDENRRYQSLLAVTESVLSHLTLKDLFTAVSEALKKYIKHDSASIVLVNKDNQLVVHTLHTAPAGILAEGMILPMDGTPAGLCIKTRAPVLRDTIDFAEFHVPQMRMAYAAGLRCGCSVPLIAHERVLGAINVGAFHEAAFTQKDIELLEEIAGPVAIAVENALNFERAEYERDHNQLLLQVAKAVTSNLSLGDLLRAVSAAVRQFVKHDFASVVLCDDASGQLRVHGLDTPLIGKIFAEGKLLPIEGTPVGQAIKTRQTLWRDKIDFEEFYAPEMREAYGGGLRSGISVPLISHDQVLGGLNVGSNREAAFSADDVKILEEIAGQVAIAVENSLNFQRAEKERDRKQLLLEVSNAVVADLTPGALLQTISGYLRRFFHHDYASVILADEVPGHARVLALDADDPGAMVGEGALLPVNDTPVGLCMATRAVVRRDSMDTAEFTSPIALRSYEEDGIRGICCVPLICKDKLLGTLNVVSRRAGAFTSADAELLEQIAQPVAIATQNAINLRRAELERDRKRLLLEINNAVVTNLDLEALLAAISDCLGKMVPHDVAALLLYDPDLHQFRMHTLNFNYESQLQTGLAFKMDGTPAGRVFETRQTLRLPLVTAEEFPSEVVRRALADGLRSVCSIPLIVHEEFLGVLEISSRRENAFTEYEAGLLKHIGRQIAIATQNSLNFERANKEKQRVQTLLEINNAISTNLEIKDLLHAISESLRGYFEHDFAGLALYDEESKQLVTSGLDLAQPADYFIDGARFSMEGTLNGVAFTTRKPVVRHRIDPNETNWPHAQKFFAEQGIKSYYCVPLVSRGRALGVLNLGSRKENALSDPDVELLQQVGTQIAIAVENSMVYQEINALKNKLASEKTYLEEEIRTQHDFSEIVGQSSALKKILQQVATVAPTDSAVLLVGETGTGKELIARAIHNLSKRQERTLVKLNCAAIPTGLLESELFGHEKGAFTGAIASRIGRFELAHKGTLLLDEIGEIPLELQPKLLRVLQEQEFERLGSSRTVKTDVRLIAATNVDLPQMVAEKKFRSDLYYRLNVFPITIPPLRERTGDIALLAGYFTQKHARRMNKKVQSISTETIETLTSYSWPGNVRELENFIERAVILTSGPELQAPLSELGVTVAPPQTNGPEPLASSGPRPVTLEDVEREHIKEILNQTKGMVGGKGGAAEILGLPISTLRNRMKKLGLK